MHATSPVQVFEVVREVVHEVPVCNSSDVAELRVAVAERDARIAELERQLEAAWQLAATAATPARTEEEARLHLEALITERDGRLDIQGALIEKLRQKIGEQHKELQSLHDELKYAREEVAKASCTKEVPVQRRSLYLQKELDECNGDHQVDDAVVTHERAQPCQEVRRAPPQVPSLRWPLAEEERPDISTPPAPRASLVDSQALIQESNGPQSSPSVSPRAQRSAQSSPREFPRPPLASGGRTSPSMQMTPTTRIEEEEAVEDGLLSQEVGNPASDIIRVGDDAIDKQVKRYFCEHPEFRVFTNKLRPGWYTFGKPIQLKVFMKLAAGEVVVRSSGTYKRLQKWLDEYRLEGDGAAGSSVAGSGVPGSGAAMIGTGGSDTNSPRRTPTNRNVRRANLPVPTRNRQSSANDGIDSSPGTSAAASPRTHYEGARTDGTASPGPERMDLSGQRVDSGVANDLTSPSTSWNPI